MPIVSKETLSFWESGKKEKSSEVSARGVLNIEGLPVYRDDKGGIGTPTSDEEPD